MLLLPLLLLGAPVAVPADRTAAPAAPGAGGLRSSAAGLSLALSSSTVRANPTGLVVVTVAYNNTGNQAAPAAWINVSASSGFTFLSDTAAGNLTGFPHYSFTAIGLGPHAYTMTFQVNVGVAPGTRLTVSATLVYSDGTGNQQFVGPSAVSVLIGVVTKQLYLGWGTLPPTILTPVPPSGGLVSAGTFTLTRGGPALNFDLSPVLARPFHVLNLTVTLYVQPLSTPTNLDMNLSLIDENGGAGTPVAWKEQVNGITGSGYWALIYTFPSLDYTVPAGHAIRLQVLNTLGSGQSALLATNATTQASRMDLQTTSYVSVDTLQPVSSPPTYLSPKSSLVILANVSDPFGSSEIFNATINVTSPSGRIANRSAMSLVLTDPSSPSAWKVFRYTVSPTLLLGTYAFVVTATERNGVADLAASSAIVRVPSFGFQKVSNVPQSKSGGKITYSLWYNNTGTGPAGTVWVNDTLPSVVNFLSSSPAAPTSIAGSTYGWVFTNVAVGPHELQVNVQVKGGVSSIGYIRNWAFLNYSDPQGVRWPSNVSHADVVLNGPVLSLGVATAPASFLHARQPAVVTFNLTNTGDQAQRIWLNVTLAAGLTYVNDTSTTLGGTSTVVGSRVAIVFSNMPSGASTPVSWRFNLTADAAVGLVGGSLLTTRFAINDSSTNGLLMPEQMGAFSLTVAAPAFTAAAASFGIGAAAPSVLLPVYVNFTNSGNEAAQTVWIDLTLGANLSFAGASVPANVSGDQVGFVLSNEPVGADSLFVTVTADTSVQDRQVLRINGTLDAVDGYGNPLPRVAIAAATVPVALPSVAFRLTPGDTTVEAGSAITYTVDGGNTGTGTASRVWLNVTLPVGLAYVNDTLGAAHYTLGSEVSWLWTSYAPGSHTYALTLYATAQGADGATANLSISVQAQDAGGNNRPVTTFGGEVHFLAPRIVLTVAVDRSQALPGQNLNYTLRVTNAGNTTASYLNLTDSLDAHLQVITYSLSASVSGSGVLTWQFRDVLPHQSLTIWLLVQVAPGTPPNAAIANVLQAQYSNSQGTPLQTVYSDPANTLVEPDLTPLLYILAIGSAAGAALIFVVYRRYRVHIEDVFLIAKDGILISHLTQADAQAKDEDQLSGMLTAVQDFVQDAFTYGRDRELHQLEFGDYHILIERGAHVYLAVVYAGRDSGLIRKKVRAVLERVEAAYGSTFDAWDGDMGPVAGTRDLLREGFVSQDRPWSLVKPKAP